MRGWAANGIVRWLPFGFVCMAAAVPLYAQQPELPDGVTPETIAEGKAIFLDQGKCHICHGVDATGARGVGADLTDDEWWHSDGSYAGIVNQILTGVPSEQAHNVFGAMMPPKGGSSIGEEQVRAVAAYVWSLRLRG